MVERVGVLLVTVLLDAQDRLRREEGQSFVEYAMVLLLITVALAAASFITPFRTAIANAFEAIGNAITGAIPS
jgi:Flp pilus assembly pilin Flp